MDDEMMHPMLLFQDYKGWTMKACMQAGTCGNARGVPQEGHRRNGRRTLIPERLLLARQVCHVACVTHTQYTHTNLKDCCWHGRSGISSAAPPFAACVMCHVSCGDAKRGRQKGGKRETKGTRAGTLTKSLQHG